MRFKLFPFEKVRSRQKEFMEDVDKVLKQRKNLVAHAPTGIGKTAGVLTPCLEYALENDKTIFFLTSRHSQHILAVETLRKISKKLQEKSVNPPSNKKIFSVNLVGKRQMCLQPVGGIPSNEFYSYCNQLREENRCNYYRRTYSGKKLSKLAKKKINQILEDKPLHSDELINGCKKLCPYEIAISLLNHCNVIICDYYHIFSPFASLLKRLDEEKSLEDLILIVDEAHNFPDRLRSLMSYKLSSFNLKRARKEAEEFKFSSIKEDLDKIDLKNLVKGSKKERKVGKQEFVKFIEKIKNYEEFKNGLTASGEVVRKEKKGSYLGSIGNFLEEWLGQEEGFVRILKREGGDNEYISLSYNCLDPSLVSSDILNSAHSSILMSGSLKPTQMYVDLLGMENTEEEDYHSDFPLRNRLNLVFPGVTTKYKQRTREQFKKISNRISSFIKPIKGNVIVYFPSYSVMEKCIPFLQVKRKVFKEKSNMRQEKRKEMLEEFKNCDEGILLGVMRGSFSEGIDLPGKSLEGVIVVGIPLAKPNLKMKSLIQYYKEKFNNGWGYAYTYPALIRVLQACGRIIRSEEDRGVVILMDKRYLWGKYRKFFSDWDLKVTKKPEKKVEEFF